VSQSRFCSFLLKPENYEKARQLFHLLARLFFERDIGYKLQIHEILKLVLDYYLINREQLFNLVQAEFFMLCLVRTKNCDGSYEFVEFVQQIVEIFIYFVNLFRKSLCTFFIQEKLATIFIELLRVNNKNINFQICRLIKVVVQVNHFELLSDFLEIGLFGRIF